MEQRGFQHQALIYAGAEEYLAGTMPFVHEALIAGEPLLIAVAEDKGALIAEELGPDAERVLFLDMQKVGHNPASIIPLWRDFVDDHEGMSVRGIGEPAWAARSEAALEECHCHEGLLNLAFARGSEWSLLCPYDAETLGDEVLSRVGLSHGNVSRRGRTEESDRFEAEPDCLGQELPPPQSSPDVLTFGVAGLGEVRRRAARAAERAGLDTRAVADLVTAASELAANSVVHGGGHGTLRLWREEDHLLAEVEDRGLIDEPLVGRLRPSISQVGGRGLWLANQLCDLVQIRSTERGTTVRLHVLACDGVLV
ncbi:MAG TPA: anti-sigma factor RsbA family regulatory protein [Solirubrobacterales bacterium]|nr:anti-sigma factor RsbA family regulatory protein [Solirubrobacterales bacterium]